MNSNFKFILIDNGVKKTLALLHGTGGDENDLLPLVKGLANEYNFLGIRGNVIQQGMNRYFIRNPDGSFDTESIREEVEKLAIFVREHPVDAFVGYSNGANMILALAFSHPILVPSAVILHGMLPFVPKTIHLQGKRFLLTYGEADQMIPATETKEAIQTLKELGASVEVVTHTGGHELHHEEIEAMEKFLRA